MRVNYKCKKGSLSIGLYIYLFKVDICVNSKMSVCGHKWSILWLEGSECKAWSRLKTKKEREKGEEEGKEKKKEKKKKTWKKW